MKIFNKRLQSSFLVLGIYWGKDLLGKEITYFMGLSPDWNGLPISTSDEVDIIDPIISFKMLFYSNRMNGLYHWALIEKFLLDGVIDNDSQATEEFLSIIRSENLVDW